LSLTPAPSYSGACTAAPINVTDTPCTASYTFAGDANHFGSNGSTTITITKANQTITWNAPATMIFGAPLSAIQLNASVSGVAGGSAPGALSYTPVAGTVLSVGSHTLTVTAAATSNYNSAIKTVTILVQYQGAGTICNGDAGHQILQPINTDGTSVWKQGSTVPAKFRVCDANGNSIGTAGVVSNFGLYRIGGGILTSVVELSIDNSTNDLGWHFDPAAQQWIYNMSTKIAPINLTNNTYYFQITLNDGTFIYFNFGEK
jgi:hypothetical protein